MSVLAGSEARSDTCEVIILQSQPLKLGYEAVATGDGASDVSNITAAKIIKTKKQKKSKKN